MPEPDLQPRTDDPRDPPARGGEETSGPAPHDEADPDGTPAAAEPGAGDEAPAGDDGVGPEDEPEDGGEDAEVDEEELCRVVEALLFASDRPLGSGRMAGLFGPGVRGRHVRKAVLRLNEAYEAQGRSFSIQEVAGGFLLTTLPAFDDWIRRLRSEEKSARLSEAALDTLAVVAYRQPILKADVNHIRGVESGPLLRTLLERGLVRVAGRADQPGRPILYGTSKKFLEVFGLTSLSDLPKTDALG